MGDFMNVLVVDDEKLIRDVIKEYLLLEKMNVTEAENGQEAIEKVKQDNFDIIIMDIMMPKMDGYTACREIKKIKDVPFIMLSARGEEYDKLIGFDLGIDDYVTKPFSPKELVARIKAVTKRKDTTEPINKITLSVIDMLFTSYFFLVIDLMNKIDNIMFIIYLIDLKAFK